jgi:hypothetical protein
MASDSLVAQSVGVLSDMFEQINAQVLHFTIMPVC